MNFNFEYWALQTVAMMLTALILPGLKISGPIPAFLSVLSLALVNAHLWDVALFFQVPQQITVQTLVLFLSNGAIFWLLVKLLPGIEVEGIWPALVAPVVFTVCSLLISKYGQTINWNEVFKYILQLVGDLRDYLNNSQSRAT